MPYQIYITFVLNTHYSLDYIILAVTGKPYTISDLISQFIPGHIGVMPPVIWNDAFVCNCRIVYDSVDILKVVSQCFPYHSQVLPAG